MADSLEQSLENVVTTGVDAALTELHTTTIGKVLAVDHENQLLDVQIAIKRKMRGKDVDFPTLVGVPIRSLKTATFFFSIPIEVGDFVKLTFMERSIDSWLESGEIKQADSVRQFSLSDAIAEPCMYHQDDVIPNFDGDNLVLGLNDGSAFIKITPSGDIYLNGSADTVVAFTDMKTAFDQLKTDLNNFITLYNTHTHGVSGTTANPTTMIGTISAATMDDATVSTVKVP